MPQNDTHDSLNRHIKQNTCWEIVFFFFHFTSLEIIFFSSFLLNIFKLAQPHRFVYLCGQQIRFQCELCTPILLFNYLDFSRFKMKRFWRSTWQHTYEYTAIAASTWHLHQKKKKTNETIHWKPVGHHNNTSAQVIQAFVIRQQFFFFFFYSFYLLMRNFFFAFMPHDCWLCLPKIEINNQKFV